MGNIFGKLNNSFTLNLFGKWIYHYLSLVCATLQHVLYYCKGRLDTDLCLTA